MSYTRGPGPLQGEHDKLKAAVGIVEDGDTATHAIAKGQYVIWKDELYTAKSDISIGTTLSSSNLQAKTKGIGEDVASLNEQIGNIGSYVEGTVSQSLSVPSGTFTRLAAMSLTKGTWVITGGFQIDSDFADSYVCQFRVNSTYMPGTKLRSNGSAGGGCNVSWIIKSESNSLAVDMMAYQGSGSAKTAAGVALRAVRIA